MLKFFHLSARTFLWLAFTSLLLIGAVLLGVRFWLLPSIGDYRATLAARLSQSIDRPVTIGHLRGHWHGTHVDIEIDDFAVHDRKRVPSLQVARARGELSWWSVIKGDVIFRRLSVEGVSGRLGVDSGGRLWLGDLSLGSSSKTPSHAVPDWLMRQRSISLTGGRLLWQDARTFSRVLGIEDIRAHYKHGFIEHRLQLAATPSDIQSRPWELTAQWRGRSLKHFDRWRGLVTLNQPLVSLASVRSLLKVPLPEIQGALAQRLSLRFQGKTLLESQWTAEGRDIRIPASDGKPALDMQRANVETTFKRWRKTGYQASLKRAVLQQRGQSAVVLGPVQIAYRPAEKRHAAEGDISVSELDLATLGRIVDYLPSEFKSRRLYDDLEPEGYIERLEYAWQGDWATPLRYRAEARFRDVGWRPVMSYPGVRGLSGQIRADETSGTMRMSGTRASFTMLRVFAHEFAFDALRLDADWKRSAEGVTWAIRQAEARNADLSASLGGEYHWRRRGSSIAALHGGLSRVEAAAVYRYLPLVISERTRTWLQQALLAGQVRRGTFVLRGPLADFPFEKHRTGLFKVAGETHGVRLRYGEAWPAIDNIHGRLLFQGHRMQIDASTAVTAGTQLSNVRAVIPQLSPNSRLIIDGTAGGASSAFLGFMANSPLNERFGGLSRYLEVEGDGLLQLNLNIPLAHLEQTRVDGRYRFAGNGIRAKGPIPSIRELNGDLSFTDHGAVLRQARGRALGGEVTANLVKRKEGIFALEISGRADAREAAEHYRLPLPERVSGATDYRSVVVLGKGEVSVHVESNLEGVAVNLPAPFGKPANEGRHLRLDYRPLSSSANEWRLRYDTLVSALLLTDDERLDRAEVAFGDRTQPAARRRGLWLTGNLPAVRLEEWQSLAGRGAGGTPLAVDGVDLTLDAVQAAGYTWPRLQLQAGRQGERWTGTITSPLIEGDIVADLDGRGSLDAKLRRFIWPPNRESAKQAATRSTGRSWMPTAWPELKVSIDQLSFFEQQLGRISFVGGVRENEYQIQTLELTQGKSLFTASGSVREVDGQLAVKLHSDWTCGDWGACLRQIGYRDVVRDGDGALSADLEWSGVLWPNWHALSGQIAVKANKGTLLKVNPGVGRLLGLINLESVIRRMRLDFQDVYREGLAFDKLTVSGRLDRGALFLKESQMSGPAVHLAMSGRIDLLAQQLDLQLKVVPALSTGVAAAGAFVNPAVGLSLLVLQQLFNNPVGQMLAYTYSIGGSWQNPSIRGGNAPLVEQARVSPKE